MNVVCISASAEVHRHTDQGRRDCWWMILQVRSPSLYLALTSYGVRHIKYHGISKMVIQKLTM